MCVIGATGCVQSNVCFSLQLPRDRLQEKEDAASSSGEDEEQNTHTQTAPRIHETRGFGDGGVSVVLILPHIGAELGAGLCGLLLAHGLKKHPSG